MKTMSYIATIILIFISISCSYAKVADIDKVKKEVSKLLQDDWLDMVTHGKTLSFCSSYIIKTHNQLRLINTEKRTPSELITYLAKEKISCLADHKASLAKLEKHTKQILHHFGLSTSIKRKFLEMRPYYIDRELYDAVTKDKLDLYLRLLAYGAYYGNTAIGESVLNLALYSGSYKIVKHLFRVEHTGLNWTTNGGSAPLSILISHKKVRYDLLNYALKVLKADPNYNGEHGDHPIIVAFDNADVKSMALLIKYGAKVNLTSYEYIGCAPEMLMDEALKKGNNKIIKLLKKAGAKTYQECSNKS